MPATPPDADTVRRAVEQVLAEGDYQLAPDPPRGEAVTEWMTWLREELLNPLRDWGDGISGRFAWADEVLAGGLVVLLSLLIARIIQARGRSGTESPSTEGAEPVVDRPKELHQQALRRGEQGEHVAAVRLLIRSAKLRLEELEHRANRPGVTNRELLRRYRQTRLAMPLATLVDTVDRGWFGNRDCSREDYLNCLAAYDEITSAARGHVRSAS